MNYPIIPNFSTFLWHASIFYFPNLLKKEKKFIIHFPPNLTFVKYQMQSFKSVLLWLDSLTSWSICWRKKWPKSKIYLQLKLLRGSLYLASTHRHYKSLKLVGALWLNLSLLIKAAMVRASYFLSLKRNIWFIAKIPYHAEYLANFCSCENKVFLYFSLVLNALNHRIKSGCWLSLQWPAGEWNGKQLLTFAYIKVS